MILEEKSETAFINLLKASKELSDIGFSHHISDEIKDHQIIVKAGRGDEVAPPSGVFELEITISLRMRNKRWSDIAGKFGAYAKIIEDLISIPQLHQHITRNCEHYHCYYTEIGASEREPQDSKYFDHNFTLSIEAMPHDFQTAEALHIHN